MENKTRYTELGMLLSTPHYVTIDNQMYLIPEAIEYITAFIVGRRLAYDYLFINLN